MCTAENLWKHFILQEVVKRKKRLLHILLAFEFLPLGPLAFPKSLFIMQVFRNLKTMKKAFQLIDVNNTGMVQSKELRRVLETFCLKMRDEEYEMWVTRPERVWCPWSQGQGQMAKAGSWAPPSIFILDILPSSQSCEFSKVGPSVSYSLRRLGWAQLSGFWIWTQVTDHPITCHQSVLLSVPILCVSSP